MVTGLLKATKDDVTTLKEIFLSYDEDMDGYVTLVEMQTEFRKRHAAVATQEASTLKRRQRKAEDRQNAFSDNLAIALFTAVDDNGDGKITFRETLQFLYPNAGERQIDAMVRFAFPEKPKEPKKTLTRTQEAEIRSIFQLYDKDGSGGLDRRELLSALQRTGLDSSEIELMHAECDLDGNGVIELDEFRTLMLNSGLYGHGLSADVAE